MATTNPMQQVRIEKVTLNIGCGKDQTKLEKGMTLIKQLAGIPPVKTVTQKRIPTWGLRPGLPVGCKLTLRKQAAAVLLKRLLVARDNNLPNGCFDENGNISFGIPEYIDVEGAAYDPKIGVMGLQASVTLEKPCHRIKRRKLRKAKIPSRHGVSKQEAIDFMKAAFSTKIEGMA